MSSYKENDLIFDMDKAAIYIMVQNHTAGDEEPFRKLKYSLLTSVYNIKNIIKKIMIRTLSLFILDSSFPG